MKVIVVNQMTAWARVWCWAKFRFVWYRVGRSGEDWRPLEIGKPYIKPKSVSEISKTLNERYPASKPLPSILDEKLADEEVKKNMSSTKKKGRG